MVKENLQVTLVIKKIAKGILDFDLITVRCGEEVITHRDGCLLYTSPSPRDDL